MYVFANRGLGVIPINLPVKLNRSEVIPGQGGTVTVPLSSGRRAAPVHVVPKARMPVPVTVRTQRRLPNGQILTCLSNGQCFTSGPVTAVPRLRPSVPKRIPPKAAPAPKPAVPGQTPLQVAEAQLNSNPCGLTSSQWALLQANNILPSTLPYASACQLPGASAGVPVLASDSTMVAGSSILPAGFSLSNLPWWAWAGVLGGGAYLAFSGKKKRGRR
jgi:hypothetical protein